jgi:hypothetical protein
MAEKKNYIRGGAKLAVTEYGEVINISLDIKELNNLKQDKGFIKLTVAKRKEIGKYGETHSVYENTFEPEKQD